jgi:hypothetical protein
MPSLRRSLLGAAFGFGSILPVLNASPIINERDNFSAADTITVDGKTYSNVEARPLSCHLATNLATSSLRRADTAPCPLRFQNSLVFY